MKYRNPVAIGFDLSRFDQHISAPMLRWEHKWYKYLFPHCHELARALRLQEQSVGSVLVDDGMVTYRKEGGRGSGDMNTSVGNCLIMCSCIYAYANQMKIDVNSFEVVDNGDDSLVITESKNYHKWDNFTKFMDDLGFVLKVEEPVYVLEKVVFCQMQPIQLSPSLCVMVRQWPKSISKDVTTTHHTKDRDTHLSYLAGIGVAGSTLTSGVPVMQEFYTMLARLATPMDTEDMGYIGMRQWSRNLVPAYVDITDDARFSFYKAFDILPDQQIAIETIYSNLTSNNFIWNPDGVVAISEYNATSPAWGYNL